MPPRRKGAKAGIVFTFTCGKSSGGSTGGGDAYAGMKTRVGCWSIVFVPSTHCLCVLFSFFYDLCVVCCVFPLDRWSYYLFLAIVVPSPQTGMGVGKASTDSYQSPDDKAGVGSVDF